MSGTFRIDVLPAPPATDRHLVHEARLLGLQRLTEIRRSRYYLLQGDLDPAALRRIAAVLLVDPVVEVGVFSAPDPGPRRVIEIQRKGGVMDPVEASVIKGAQDLGLLVTSIRVGSRIEVADATDADLELLAWKCLANRAVEDVAIDPAQAVRWPNRGGMASHGRREVPIRGLDDAGLRDLSRNGCLSLDLGEMHSVQAHFRDLGREPSDVELETVAQTWSEHCVHKTLRGLIDYRGPEGDVVIDNLLKQTIARATHELAAPWCWSVFEDNSGVIAFDDDIGVCIKVETHNHPSAIEPYGGANTGLGGVVRDILGTGLGAKPIFNTDVFCFGELDLDPDELPPGAIHPRRLMRAVVAGVRDYGNRMGIPTVNGAVRFDRRYVGNPLVFCGTAGLIPRWAIAKAAQVGDHILVIGGATGRDGIHGATFSSVELTSDSEVVSSGAVQIGNAIEEKKIADTMLQARDLHLFHAVTDCGAGGLSSAVGEIAAEHGCSVHLDRVRLKYTGLGYAEIWISESQERMVACVGPGELERALAVFRAEDVSATDIGVSTGRGRLELFHGPEQVADLDMGFLHHGLPRQRRAARFAPVAASPLNHPQVDLASMLCKVLARPNVASKEWVIRQYDHEVQGGSVIKPLVGICDDGPSDAAVVAPVLGSDRGVAVACGLNTSFSDADPYLAAAAGIEEALRNLVCVGAGLDAVALLDNFSWGNCAKPENLGALVRACQACYDLAMYYRTPFISGKDSLNNEYSFRGRTIVIPHTLLITALTVMDDVGKAISMDLKAPGDAVFVVGLTRDELGGSEFVQALGLTGGSTPGLDRDLSLPVLRAVASLTRAGLITAAHDASDGGLGVTLAEMAFAGGLGLEIDAAAIPRTAEVTTLDHVLFSESNSRIVVTAAAGSADAVEALLAAVPHARIGTVVAGPLVTIRGLGGQLEAPWERLKAAWQGGLRILAE